MKGWFALIDKINKIKHHIFPEKRAKFVRESKNTAYIVTMSFSTRNRRNSLPSPDKKNWFRTTKIFQTLWPVCYDMPELRLLSLLCSHRRRRRCRREAYNSNQLLSSSTSSKNPVSFYVLSPSSTTSP